MPVEIAVAPPFGQIALGNMPMADGEVRRMISAQCALTGVQVSIVFDAETWANFLKAANGGIEVVSDLSKLDGLQT